MSNFKQYRRSQIAEIKAIDQADIDHYAAAGYVRAEEIDVEAEVSISQADRNAGSPKLGDMVGRNPKNHMDQWLIAEQYFNDNFESI